MKNKTRNDVIFSIVVVALVIVRYFILAHLPIWHMINQGYDDTLYLYGARNILQGNWLGTYSTQALVKVESIYLFYVLIYLMKIPFMVAIFFLYFFASITAYVAFIPCVRNKWIRLLISAAVLYFPLATTDTFGTRVHKFALSAPLLFILLFLLIGIYFRLNDSFKKRLPWFIFLGIDLAFYLLLREEAVLCITLPLGLLVLELIRNFAINKCGLCVTVRKAAIWIVPIIVVLGYLLAVSFLNWKYYGLFTISDRTGTTFSKMVGLMTNIDDGDEADDNVWLSKKSLDLAIDASPTLKSIEKELRELYDSWSVSRGRTDGQTNGDDFIWAIRTAMAQNGYYRDAKDTNLFCKKVTDELEEAYAKGEISGRKGIRLSFMMPKQTIKRLLNYFKETLYTLWDINTYGMAGPEHRIYLRTEEIVLAEKITSTAYILENEYLLMRESFYGKVNALVSMLVKPFAIFGRALLSLQLVLISAWIAIGLLTKTGYLYWERIIVAVGLNFVYFLEALAITVFALPWQGQVYYCYILLPFSVCIECYVILFFVKDCFMKLFEKRKTRV